jgi:hypothetical protein
LIPALFQLLGSLLFTSLGYGSLEGNSKIIGYALFLPASVLIWFVGKYLNKPKVQVDHQTGQQYVSKGRHALFFIPVEYWAFIFPIVAIILTIVQLVQ